MGLLSISRGAKRQGGISLSPSRKAALILQGFASTGHHVALVARKSTGASRYDHRVLNPHGSRQQRHCSTVQVLDLDLDLGHAASLEVYMHTHV